MSRLLTYGAVCVALVVFRRRDRSGEVESAWFHLPAGTVVAGLGLLFSAVLTLRMSRRELAVLAATLAAGFLHWIWMRARGPAR